MKFKKKKITIDRKVNIASQLSPLNKTDLRQ